MNKTALQRAGEMNDVAIKAMFKLKLAIDPKIIKAGIKTDLLKEDYSQGEIEEVLDYLFN